ncbi:MAG: DNA primase [Candidatus Omnitrophica bacterium]|nr:DNA primase [Candidatus Omnitrophota bacterium]
MPLIPEDIVSQVIERSDIVEIVANYVALKKAGRNFKGLSPFNHEKTASFIVSPDKQIYHCFSSGVGGNVVSFIMQMERLDFPEAIRFLARKHGIEIPERNTTDGSAQKNNREIIFQVNELAANYFHNILLSDKSTTVHQAREYLKQRGVSLETVKKFKLGFALDQWDGLIQHLRQKNIPLGIMETAGLIIARDNKEGYYDRFRNRIIFPIADIQSRIRAFGARTLENAGAKYINSPETDIYTKGEYLYGFDLAKSAVTQNDFAVIVEGYMDCIMPQQAGYENIVASLGTALTQQQIRNVRRFTKNVVMLYDNDKAGEAAMIRSFDLLIEEGINVKVGSLAEGEDPDSFIRKFGIEIFRQKISESKNLFDYKLHQLNLKYDSKTVEGKAKICDEMLPTINRYSHSVKQAGYIQQLAVNLGLTESVLMVELRKLQEGIRPSQQEPIKVKKIETIAPTAESSLLKLLLEENGLIESTQKDVNIEDFQDSKVKSVISRLFDLFDQGKDFNSLDLINSFDDEETVRFITSLVADEQVIVSDKEKVYRDCVNRLKKDRVKEYRRELLELIREAEEAGDLNKLEILKQQFNQSVKN